MNKTSLLIVVALLSSAFSVNQTFAQGTSLEWRTVYNSKDNFQCGYLLPTKPKTPTARPDGVRDDAEFRTVLREGGRPVNGWLQADIGVHERGTCPHCKARAKGNPSVGNTSVTNVSVPSPGFNRGGYNAARTQRLGVATGAYTPVPGVPASNSGMFINGAWYAQPPKTTVDMLKCYQCIFPRIRWLEDLNINVTMGPQTQVTITFTCVFMKQTMVQMMRQMLETFPTH